MSSITIVNAINYSNAEGFTWLSQLYYQHFPNENFANYLHKSNLVVMHILSEVDNYVLMSIKYKSIF